MAPASAAAATAAGVASRATATRVTGSLEGSRRKGYGQICEVPDNDGEPETLARLAARCMAVFGRAPRVWGAPVQFLAQALDLEIDALQFEQTFDIVARSLHMEAQISLALEEIGAKEQEAIDSFQKQGGDLKLAIAKLEAEQTFDIVARSLHGTSLSISVFSLTIIGENPDLGQGQWRKLRN